MEQGKYRILFVEDDLVDQMAFERFAGRDDFPYDYSIAGSLHETLEILPSETFDAVVVDYLLGDGTALDLFDALRDMPIIIVTGIGNEEIAVNAMKAGAYDYLIKDPEGNYLKTLVMTVGNAISRKQAEVELQNHREHLEELVERRTAELKTEIDVRKRAEIELQRSLKEKEVLLRELHHRVKNNLQVISSLLDLQSEDVKDQQARDVFLEAQNRIRSMAHIHEQLYQSNNLAELNVSIYIEQLVHTLLQSYGKTNVVPQIRVDAVSLDMDTAVSCGLIVNELVSNALKYAFTVDAFSPEKAQHEILVALSQSDERLLSLVVRDNGVGLSNMSFDEPHALSFGLRLVKMLVRQLKGTIAIDGSRGTCVTTVFPVPRSSKKS